MSATHFPPERYVGNSFLRLVDAWVLKCLGVLDPAVEANLRAMEPKLQATYKRANPWNEIVRLELDYPAEVEEEIRTLWKHNTRLAQNAGQELGHLEFVEMFVKANVLGPN